MCFENLLHSNDAYLFFFGMGLFLAESERIPW
jgi:hypothetical protein